MSGAAAPVKVRFAPSPTGYLHVGGARTALYNWLYAKRQGGSLVLRIEDTDRERSTQESIDAILKEVEWMGLTWDEGPYFQSERLDLYREYAQKLIDAGAAKRLDDGTEAVIFQFPVDGQTVIGDMVHGKIVFENKDIKDQVLIKSDGYPAYTFACVVDDALMGISHVVRGDDHISNTPKQIAIYQALGLKVPKYAHIPLILGPDGTRLSKRHGATAVGQFAKQGFLSEGFVNYLALLGWSAGDNKELYSLEELTKKFSLKRVTGKSAIFDGDKLSWINSQWIKSSKAENLGKLLADLLKEQGVYDESFMDESWLSLLGEAFKGRVKNLQQILDESAYLLGDDYSVDQQAFDEHFSKEDVRKLIGDYRETLSALSAFTLGSLKKATEDFVEEQSVKMTEVFHPLRVAVSGKTVTPGVYEVLALLGKERVLTRLNKALGH